MVLGNTLWIALHGALEVVSDTVNTTVAYPQERSPCTRGRSKRSTMPSSMVWSPARRGRMGCAWCR